MRDCVERGSRLPQASAGVLKDASSSASGGGGGVKRNWEREAAVMVGSIVGVMGR